ncbi:hypothetical protein C8Q79DRAFT_299168 [Trametes meyenii]|nr:hypothetical protein C8Q79DRAFT_299168 [Trametes meyenii]
MSRPVPSNQNTSYVSSRLQNIGPRSKISRRSDRASFAALRRFPMTATKHAGKSPQSTRLHRFHAAVQLPFPCPRGSLPIRPITSDNGSARKATPNVTTPSFFVLDLVQNLVSAPCRCHIPSHPVPSHCCARPRLESILAPLSYHVAAHAHRKAGTGPPKPRRLSTTAEDGDPTRTPRRHCLTPDLRMLLPPNEAQRSRCDHRQRLQ